MNSGHTEDNTVKKKMLSVQRPSSATHCACCTNHDGGYTNASHSPTSPFSRSPTSSGSAIRFIRQQSFDQPPQQKGPTKTKIFTPNINLRDLFLSEGTFPNTSSQLISNNRKRKSTEENQQLSHSPKTTEPPPLFKSRLTDHLANGFNALESSNSLLKNTPTTKYYKYQQPTTTLSIVKPKHHNPGQLIRIQHFEESHKEKIEKFPMALTSPGPSGFNYELKQEPSQNLPYERRSPNIQSPFERTNSPYRYPSPHSSQRASPNLPSSTTMLTSPPPLVRTTPPPSMPPNTTPYMGGALNVASARYRSFKQPNSFDSTSASIDSSLSGSDEEENDSMVLMKPRPTPSRVVERAKYERTKYERTIKLYKFLIDLLEDQHPCVMWIDRKIGIFKITDSEQLAQLWGEVKLNASMTYEKLARSFRHYYKKGILDSGETVISPVSKNGKRKLYYKFSAVTLKRFLDIDPE